MTESLLQTAGTRWRACREAQATWAATTLPQRLAIVRTFRMRLVQYREEFHRRLPIPSRTLAQTTTAEIMPLAAACRWLEKRGEKTLRPRSLSRWGRPIWLPGVSSVVSREPHGLVLILGTWNYPIFLTGVQLLQALVAGNTVLIKPGNGCEPITRLLVQLLHRLDTDELNQADSVTRPVEPEVGVDRYASPVQVLGEHPSEGIEAIDKGVDHIVLTGSASTGRAVLTQAASQLTSSTVELSGCDAMYVLPSADRDRVIRSVAFGLRFNASATCIAPRRILLSEFGPNAKPPPLGIEAEHLVVKTERGFVEEQLLPHLESIRISSAAGAWQQVDPLLEDAAQNGAKVVDRRHDLGWVVVDHATPEMAITQRDLFAPVISIMRCQSIKHLLVTGAACPYALAASVFGSEKEADAVVPLIRAGVVTINDVIVPTADPRMPFGGFGSSGFGATRGPEGLLAMTRPRVVAQRRWKWLPHLDEEHPTDAELLGGAAELIYGPNRWDGFKRMMSAGKARTGRK